MSKKSNFHESYNLHDDLEIGSNRSFGMIFTAVFFIIGFLTSGKIAVSLFVLASLFLLLSIIAPDILEPLNLVWFKFGLFLNKIVSPVILGLLFFLVFTPMALFFRIMGKDPLKLKLDKSAKTYWTEKKDDGRGVKSMVNQF